MHTDTEQDIVSDFRVIREASALGAGFRRNIKEKIGLVQGPIEWTDTTLPRALYRVPQRPLFLLLHQLHRLIKITQL